MTVPRHQAGFSLIEVVVAVAIAGVSLAALLHAAQGNAARSALSHEYVLATTFGESMLARIGRDIPLDAGIGHGRSAEGFSWSRTIKPYPGDRQPAMESDDAPVLPYEIVVTVSWRSGGKPHDLSLRSLRLKPSRSDAD